MAAISASDYTSHDQHEIFAQDINNRIEELKRGIREAQQESQEPDADDVEECDALIAFRHRVEAETGNHFDEATIVPEDEFQNHARDWAHGISDFEFMDKYVKWEEFAEDLKTGGQYNALDFGDDLVYVR